MEAGAGGGGRRSGKATKATELGFGWLQQRGPQRQGRSPAVAGWAVPSRIRRAGDAAGQAQGGGGCGRGRHRDWDGEGADESERERRRERKKGGEAGKEDRKLLYIFGGLAPK